MRYRLFPVLHVVGMMLVFYGVTYLMTIATSIIYNDEELIDFIDAMVFCDLVGFGLWWLTRQFTRELQARDGFLLVTLA